MNGLPSGWRRRALIELQAKKKWALNGGPFGSKLVQRDYVDSGVPVIRGVNLSGEGKFNDNDFVYVAKSKADELRANNAQPGDVIFTQRGTLGQVGLIPKRSSFPRYVISQSQMKMTVDESQVLSEWIYYYFTAPLTVTELINKAFSSGVPHINLGILRELQVPLPPLPTQRKIAAILSAYDDLIKNNVRRIKILEEMAQNLYREWFVKFRFPGHQHARFIDSPLGRIPEGWEIKALGELVNTQYGYTESAQEKPIGPKYLRGMDINKTTYINWDEVPYCPIPDYQFPKYQLAEGDIIIIRMADPGKVGIVEKDMNAVFASYLVRLSRTSNRIGPYYLFHFLIAERYQGYITGASTGTTRKSASAGVLTGIDMLIPPESILADFESQVQTFRRLLNNLLERNTTLRHTRDLLLPKLISGEVDVSELDITIPEEATA